MKIRNITTTTSSIISNRRSSILKKSVDVALLANVIHGNKKRVNRSHKLEAKEDSKGSVYEYAAG